MIDNYKDFISFLNKNVKTNNEIDMIIYNIGTVQRIVEQYTHFLNEKIKKTDDDTDFIDVEIMFENECNKKIALALGIGDEAVLFVECSSDNENHLYVNINKIKIAELTLEEMR